MSKHFTKPKLRERIKNKIMRSSKGGRPGQWSARKSQMLVREYEKAGGGYKGRKTKSAKALTRWTKQKWTTKSGKRSRKTGERYLPERLIKSMSSSQYAYETRKKKSSNKKRQTSSQVLKKNN